MGAAGDVVVDEPLAVQRPQQAQDAHVGFGEEDVVDHALPTKNGPLASFPRQIKLKLQRFKYAKDQRNH